MPRSMTARTVRGRQSAAAGAPPYGDLHVRRGADSGGGASNSSNEGAASLERLHLGNFASAMAARWPVSKAVRGRPLMLRLPGDLLLPLKVCCSCVLHHWHEHAKQADPTMPPSPVSPQTTIIASSHQLLRAGPCACVSVA